MHLRQPGFTYSGCGTFILKTKKKYKNFEKLEIEDKFNKMN